MRVVLYLGTNYCRTNFNTKIYMFESIGNDFYIYYTYLLTAFFHKGNHIIFHQNSMLNDK